MRPPGIIPDSVRLLQREVSNPSVSAWVAANAGSGKTHVLVQRVINLLLDGVEPEKILCITFTKAAAANMAKRVFDTLAEWTTLDDTGLDKAIRERSNLSPTLRAARWRGACSRARSTPRAASRCTPSTLSAPSSCISSRSRPMSPPAQRARRRRAHPVSRAIDAQRAARRCRRA